MLRIEPIFQKEAFAFISDKHRHHIKPVGSVFQLAVSDGEKIVGVAVIGRPVSRVLQDGYTLEVTRLCTDGTKNCCSMLYSAAWRIVKEMGYKTLLTYIHTKIRIGYFLKSGWLGNGRRKRRWNLVNPIEKADR